MNLPFETALRQKDSREAADTGILLWRENFFCFLPFFAIPFWVCAFVLRMLPGNMQYYSWLILWWLKPFFDRSIMHVISVRFFENNAGMKRLLRGLARDLFYKLPGDLLWRRFSPYRCAIIPFNVLETKKNLRIENYKRKRLLKENGINYSFLLTFWGIAVEIALLTGEILFFIVMADLVASGYISYNVEFLRNAEIFIFAVWCFNYMLVETLYVCMGFSLYINSRINVEGWDIEIMFRSFAKKLKNKKINSVLTIIILLYLFTPDKVSADDFQLIGDNNVPVEALHKIFSSPDFGGSEKESWGIRLKKPIEPQDIPDININPMLERLRLITAFLLRFILVSLIVFFAFILFLYVRKLLIKKKTSLNKSYINTLHGFPEKNPQMLLEESINFYKLGNLRLAWGYCTAAAIISLQKYRGFVFPPNATETDCADIVNSRADSGSQLSNREEFEVFNTLIKHWINFAYAGRYPPEGVFEEAAAFCKTLIGTAINNKIRKAANG